MIKLAFCRTCWGIINSCLIAGVSVTEALRDTHTQMKHRKERKAELLPATQHMRLHLLKGKFSSFSLKSYEVLIKIYIYIHNKWIN